MSTSNNSNRIKLAEAMGWKVEECDREYFNEPTMSNGRYGHLPHMSVGMLLPDPFTDANDDYAVLEWMITKTTKVGELWKQYTDSIPHLYCENYRIGDYARAALKVIEP